jgi:hypothetical protein
VASRAPFRNGRISDIAQVLGQPDVQRHDRAAVHRCYWNCGCEAINTRGLCIEDGWAYAPCLQHPPVAALTVDPTGR